TGEINVEKPGELFGFAANQQPFNGSPCPWCGSSRTWRYHHWNDNYIRGNGVEVDKSDYYEVCSHCGVLFVTHSGYSDKERNGVFPMRGSARTLTGKLRDALENFLKTGEVSLDARE
ncbi:MAG TPA: hypothetical protein PKO06_11810, partial [Candidatus Ozemobacteraceae bacterium]|nr:hypothetical protein [Candidatus Ozemobacteraceae bacterium]